MHGCSSGSALLVNAEVDSMGGVVDGGVGFGLKTSPRRAAIEKAQAELRQEYDVREERRRELEFLEKGGNPLDFKFRNGASLSVQSTSLTDQHPEQFLASDAKGSFALTASPLGDSVESSGRPEVPTLCEPNSADNLLLFDGENDVPDGERNSKHLSRRNNVGPSEQSSRMEGTQNIKESDDSAIFRPYARRNRSRPNRDGTRSNSTDIQGRGGPGPSFSVRTVSKDSKRLTSETNNQKEHNIPSAVHLKSASSNGDIAPKIVTSDNPLDIDLEGVQAPEIVTGPMKDSLERKLDVATPKSLRESQHSQPSQVDAQETPIGIVSERSDIVVEREPLMLSGLENPPCAAATKTENDFSSAQMNGFSNLNRESKSAPHEGQISSANLGTKGLDSESSCTQTSVGLDVNNDSDMCTTTRNADIGDTIESLDVDGTRNPSGDEMVKEDNETKAVDGGAVINDHQASVCQNHSGNSEVKVEKHMFESRSPVHNEVNLHSNIEGEQQTGPKTSETNEKVDNVLDNNSNPNKDCTGLSDAPQDFSMCDVPESALPGRDTAADSDCQTPGVHLNTVNKAHEDSILEEARIIEAKRKRIAELSIRTLPSENLRKSQWDFVLEEMAWLANDFAQERIWKVTAAAQICHRVAFTSRLRIEEQHRHWELKRLAHELAKAVNQFWHSAEVLSIGDDSVESMRIDRIEASKDKNGESNMDPRKELEPKYPRKDLALYAVRFLKYNSSLGPQLQAQAPATPERMSDVGIKENSWEDHLTEENLFYAVPAGAMETYRKSIESHLVRVERTGNSMEEEVETSMYDAGGEFGLQETAYDEEEGETSTYYLPGAFEGSKSSKSNQKKRNLKLYASRSYEAGADLPYGQCTTATQQSLLMGKRPASLNVGSIPTKRMRTASRQRVVSPFGVGPTGTVQPQIKTDASSEDTNSLQDDQSTLHGGSHFQKSVEVESAGDFEKQVPYDYAETSMKPKKKKKAKHLGSTYDQGWQLDSPLRNEQRDHSKRRLESHHFESNGLYGQHNAKKQKLLKQSLDNTFDSMTPITGSIPSPVGSQMSNLSNTSKFIKLIGGRDRGRKTKSLKMSVGQQGSGGPWSLFEDQALVVLVHDMGPNWELISDAINSTLHLKCIFRKPKECKERHKILMDMTSGDGADSAEDSGSSQPYPSTIPGIPKGSARQLFQRLQEPMEEDTLKSHFEKIIKIGQKHVYRRSQNDNQDHKQVTTFHNSHAIALSQVSPNNLNGSLLTPLDLCDATSSSSDVLGYQGSHSSALATANQGAIASLLPSGANSSVQGSSGVVLGSNLPSPSGPLSANVSYRDSRYSGPRTSSSLVDEQQRMQHYNQLMSGRNIQQSGLSVPGALSGTDRGARMVSGATGVGMMCGMNRGMPMSRPGFQGMTSSSMLNSGSMLSSSMASMPSPVNMQSGAGSGQGNLMLRPRDALNMMRPGPSPEHQRQLMVPELQMQVTQGNGQGIASFNGSSSGFPNQTTPPSVQTYPGHGQQQHQVSQQQSHSLSSPHHPHLQGPNHATGSQQQVYAFRIAKERPMQQRYLHQQHQQQQFAASNSLVPHAQPQSQLLIPSSLQNSSQIQSQTSPHPVSVSPMTPSSPMTPLSSQYPQKHHLPPHGLSRNPGAGGMPNQMGKQRQRQPQQHHLQQSGRHHPQQRQLAQAQQQAKISKGMSRGNSMVHQNLSIDPTNLSIDPSHLNPGSQALDKGEQMMQLMQGQGAYSGGSGLNSVASKPLVPQASNHSQLPQKLLSTQSTPSSKQPQHMPSLSDNSTQGQVPPKVPSSHTVSASYQTDSSPSMTSNHQQPQPQPQPQQQRKQANQTQPFAQRVLQHNRQVNLEIPSKSQSDVAQADERPVNGASQVGVSTAVPQSGIDSSSVVPVSSASTQWKSSEPVCDSNVPNSTAQVGAIGSPPPTNSSGNGHVPPISQGLGSRQLSGGLPSHGHDVGAQWQQQQQQQLLQRSSSMPSPSQQQYPQQEQQQEQQSSQHQLPLQPQSQQQMQQLQVGQGSLYMMTGNSKPE